MIREPFIAHSELTNEIYIVIGKEKCCVTKQAIKAVKAIRSLEQEPQSFKWCTDCKEYDQEKHCCHRYSKVIRDTVAEIGQESTTKNDLAVDAVSRKAVINQIFYSTDNNGDVVLGSTLRERIARLPSVTPQEPRWIPVSERLPETDGENSINNYDVLLWVKDKNDPDDEPQIYLGKLRQVKGDDGSGNFWGIKTEPCDWTIWGWSYFHEPEVIAWHPLPEPYKAEIEPQESEVEDGKV